jgi:hypothetical protein
MRAGAIISAIAHALVVVWALFGTPKPFDTASGEPVAVDLIPASEAPPAPSTVSEPKPEPAPKFEALPPPLVPPRATTVTELPSTSVPQAAAKASAPPPPAPAPQQAPPQRSAAAPPTASPASPAASPASPAAPVAPPQSASSPSPPPAATSATPSIFDPASIPKLMVMAPTPPAAASPTLGFDAPADVAADLSREEVVAFKTHLKKCLRLPAGVDAERKLRVTMRVFLKPDGSFSAEPMLVAASAAREGPALVKAATDALNACQPYALPAAKYNDWKMLDLTLSPRDMAGG